MSFRNKNLAGFALIAGLAVLFFCGKSDAGTQDAPERLRDPFWPVGYVPEGWAQPVVDESDERAEAGVALEAEDAGWDAALEKLQIAGVSRKGGTAVVIVNGRVIKMGSTISVVSGDKRYSWQVDSVDERGSLKLNRLGVSSLGNNR